MSFVAGAGTTNIDLLFQNIPKLPKEGEEVYTDKFSLQIGGGAVGTLINLSRLNIQTRVATELGNDMFSNFVKAEFEKNCVAPLNLFHGSGIPLNISTAIILPNDRSFVSYGKGEFEPDDDAKQAFYQMAKGAKICLMAPGGFQEVYQKLKKDGTIMVFDTGWDDELSFEKYGAMLEIADYFTPNCKEALKITGCGTYVEAAQVLSRYFNKVLIKLDKNGCYGLDENGSFVVPSVESFKAVDSTGAGDAFLAGFCYGLFYDYSFRDCIAFGNLTGGKSVTKAGALAAYLAEEELLNMKKCLY